MTSEPSGLARPLYVFVVETGSSGTAPGERREPPARYDIVARETRIGRSRACTIRLDDVSVSREHARLVLRDPELHLDDLGSTNRTRLDGALVRTRVRVRPGSVLSFGAARCRIEAASGVPAAVSDDPAISPGNEPETGAEEIPVVGNGSLPQVFMAGPLPGEPRRARLRAALGLAAAIGVAVLLFLLWRS